MAQPENTLKEIRERRVRKRGILWKILFALFLFALAVAAAGAGALYYLIQGLPSISSLKDYRPSIITRVYGDGNELIDEFYLEDRKVIDITELPKPVIQAFVAAEDSRFFRHGGVDLQGIVRAFVKNVEAGAIVQGGSTITQQVAKSLFLTPERSYVRKLREAILAYRIDRYLTKYEILNLYLNQIYLGHGTYGVEAASERYFGKSARELNAAEAALLAGLPKAPSRYSPYSHPDRARNRQEYVLARMAEEGFITEQEKEAALGAPIELRKMEEKEKLAPYFTELVRRYVQEKYGSEVLYREGLEVFTTLNVGEQQAAREAFSRGLGELDKRQGYRGPLRKLKPEEYEAFLASVDEGLPDGLSAGASPGAGTFQALVVGVDSPGKKVMVRIGRHDGVLALKDMAWARKPDPAVAPHQAPVLDPAEVLSPGDVILVRLLPAAEGGGNPPWSVALEQEPEVQGALIAMEVKTGEIKALMGGRDYRKSEFNRATQSRRQPGSAFKPFLYAAAFDNGLTPSSIVLDTPIIFHDTLRDSTWKPQNYEERFYGPTPLRTALIKSRNLVTIKVLKDIGIDYAADYVANMGIQSPLTKDLSMALGSSGVTLEEMVRAYGVLADEGKRVKPFLIRKIVDRTGYVFEENGPEEEQVMDPRIAYVTTHLLIDVVERGTGWRVRALGRPLAGKTGTTNDLKDAWFIGFTPSLVAGVWVGFDDLKPLGKFETGSRAASPIFLYFMQKALKDRPVESFSPPKGVVFVKVDPVTGFLAAHDSGKGVVGCYLEGTEPVETAPAGGAGEKSFFRPGVEAAPQPSTEEEDEEMPDEVPR
jgi:penicillin-binding protein 1A